MTDIYQIPGGEIIIEYRHEDGTKALDERGMPIFDKKRMKPSEIERLVEEYSLEPFLVIREQ